jgi:hypothetical protein
VGKPEKEVEYHARNCQSQRFDQKQETTASGSAVAE